MSWPMGFPFQRVRWRIPCAFRPSLAGEELSNGSSRVVRPLWRRRHSSMAAWSKLQRDLLMGKAGRGASHAVQATQAMRHICDEQFSSAPSSTSGFRCLQVLCGVPDSLVSVQLSNQVASSITTQHWELSLEVLQEALRFGRWSVVSTNTALSAHLLLSGWQRARATLAQQERRSRTDVISWNTVMAACSRAGQAELSGSITPNAVSDAALLTAVGTDSIRQWPLALLLISRMQALDQLQVMSLNAAVAACGNANEWTKSLQLAQRKPSPRSMGSMLAACGDATEWERVLQIFLHVKNSKLSNMFTYGAAITACSRGERFQQKRRDHPEMHRMCRGAWPQALHLLSQARKDSCCDAICMNAAISACRSNWELSVALLQEANEERLDTAVAYAAVMTACDRCEQPVKVLACWAAIPKKSHAAACSLALRACESRLKWSSGSA
eukprot:g33190.t1